MEKTKEKIGYYKMFIPLLWTGIFITIGGIGWLINNHFPSKENIIIIFILATIIFIISLLLLHKRIRKLLKEF